MSEEIENQEDLNPYLLGEKFNIPRDRVENYIGGYKRFIAWGKIKAGDKWLSYLENLFYTLADSSDEDPQVLTKIERFIELDEQQQKLDKEKETLEKKKREALGEDTERTELDFYILTKEFFGLEKGEVNPETKKKLQDIMDYAKAKEKNFLEVVKGIDQELGSPENKLEKIANFIGFKKQEENKDEQKKE